MGVVNKMKFQAIRRSTTPEMVIGEILKSVKSGQLKPGDKLPPERELTQMFGVGRSSIREAITALALMGYRLNRVTIFIEPGHGTDLNQKI